MRKTGSVIAGILLLSAWASPSFAALTVEIVNGYNLVVDSNVTAPSTYAPKSAYIAANVCNTGGAPLNNVFAYVGDSAGGTPGIFPVTTFGADPLRPHLAGTGDYSFTLEAADTGIADGTRYIGTLAANTCRIQYWLFSYPQCVNVGGQPQSPPCDVSIAGGIKPDDDLSLSYDVWATSTTGLVTTVASGDFTMRNEISAAANKIWPNTTAKVPDEYLTAIESVIGWGTLGPDGQPLTEGNPVYPGQRLITTQGIWYDLGNVGQGFDNDGDLVPDQNAWLQPVGDPASFDAGCFRMVNVYGIVIVKLKTGGELLIPFQNQLYYQNIPDNTGVVGLVYYQYIATDTGCSANMTPYQEAASGFDNEKFSADYGLSLGLVSGTYDTDLTFTKTDGETSVLPGGGLTYTVSANNLSTGVNLGAPDHGTPLTFRERIPAGATYVAGSAEDIPAAPLSPPSGIGSFQQGYTDTDGNLDTCTINYSITSSSYTVLYSTDSGVTWSLTEPAAASVTDIAWLLATNIALDGYHDGTDCVVPDGTYDDGTEETSLPVGKTASVAFGVTVKSNPGPVLCNSAFVQYGFASSSTEAVDCDLVTGNNTLSGVVFKDDGVGAATIFGNGIKELNEGVIGPDVVVSLYYDVNGDGVSDSGDLLYGSTSTDASGAFSFATLPDGPFLVVVKKYDGATSDGTDNAATDAGFGTTGWGNTTFDPNLPLTTDQGILKLNEDFTTATLAVNIDLDGDNGTGQSITGVDFGFAPPFRLTKSVPTPSVDEGDLLNYSILLENRLPSAGVQGPTGCQYTVWAPTGVNGPSAGNKDFSNPGYAWDGPNRKVATALVEGGGNREIDGRSFSIADQAGSITKVEALFFGYYDQTLDDDSLAVQVTFGAGTVADTIPTALIDGYIGESADLDPDSAISWDITGNRPPGGAWTWADDFSTVVLYVNPKKSAVADNKIFSLDAIGLRITTDADCVAGASTTLSPVPLQDRFDATSFAFVSANPPPTSVSGGTITWDDVGPILPGSSTSVTVTVMALDVNGTVTGTCAVTSGPSNPPPAGSVCNLAETAFDGKNVFYADGRQANDDDDKVPVNIVGKAELRGTVWIDANNDGWPNNDGEAPLPKVTVTLFACMQVDGVTLEPASDNKACDGSGRASNYWKVMATTTTDASGNYEFIGLDTGTYIVEVGDTDGAPQTGNTSPYGGTQTAEPNDAQTVDGSNNAVGTNGLCAGGCNNTWGNPANNLSAHNQLDASTEETINGVNFGYYITTATLYGNVWHDIDGDATVDGGESGLPGFTVQLYSDPNGDGDPSDGTVLATTNSDAGGNYTFSGLAADDYVIVVTPPTLLTQSWVETVETTGGIGSLNNQIPVTLAAGEFSGSHDFGYTRRSTSDIGDTVFFDFNANGVQDGTEAGIPNITVWLYEDVDRDGTIDDGVDALLATDVTDVSGKYLFVDLPAGSYVVKVDTTDSDFPSDVTVTGDPDVNTGRIGDRIFYDANGDGLAGTARSFAGGTTNGSPTVTSAGLFLASDVGAMIKGVGIPIGAIITGYTNASTVTISANATATGAPTLNLTFDDGIAGVVVHLYANTDGDDTIDPGELQVAATITDVNGNYLFTGLSAGNYLVEVDSSTLPSAALALTSPPFTNIALATNGSSYLAADAGYSPSSNYALGDRVWVDANGNNVQDPGEMGVPGVTITVTNGTGTGCAGGCTVTTDEGGFWVVTGLTNGTFSVDVNPGGAAKTLAGIRDFDLTSGTEALTVTISNADNMGVDFGYRFDTDDVYLNDRDVGDPTGTIDGRVYVDVNADDVYGRLLNGTTTSGSTTVTSAALFLPGDVGSRIEGVGIPLGATITGYTDASTVTISAAATATGATALTVAADTVRAGTTVNLIDQNGYIVATTTTNANGMYYFGGSATCTMTTTPACSGVFLGRYTVQSVDALGTFYSVLFLNAAQSISNLNVVYNATVESVVDSQSAVSVDGVHDNLLQDFGYQRFQGSIGDTVYHDVNENATQDLGEPGFGGVTVRLYTAWWGDANGNGLSESGESVGEVLVSTTTTTADDPLTAADEGGKYLFSNLATPLAARSFAVATTDTSTTVTSAGLFLATDVGRPISGTGIPDGATITGFTDANTVTISAAATATGTPTLSLSAQYYLVRVDTTTLPGTTKTLIADPDTDGFACTLLPDPDVPSDVYPPPGVCDDEQLVRGFSAGINYLGADFGYQISGAGYASFGDTLWVDANGDGIKDAGEVGVPYVAVWLDTNGDGLLAWKDTNGNGAYDERTILAGTTDTSTTVTSAGLFLATDVGRQISGTGIPAGATITAFTSASSVTISLAATATGSATLTLFEGERWVETDANGYYAFTGLVDGTYNVRVLTTRSVLSATTNGSTTVTSAGLFLPNDVGSRISGTGSIPAGATITSFVDTSTVTISIAATADDTPTLALTDWPVNLPTTPTYEVRSSNTGSLDNAAQVVIAAGVVTSIVDGFAGNDPDTCVVVRTVASATTSGSTTVTSAGLFLAADVGRVISGTGIPASTVVTSFVDASTITISNAPTSTGTPTLTLSTCDNMQVDFGYRYAGTFNLSGTICGESGPLDGFCGDNSTDPSGVGLGEFALAGIQVGLYLWNDAGVANQAWNAGTGALDAGDTFTLLGTTSTNASGDYSFTNVPAGKLVVVFGVSDTQNLRLTTDATNSSVEGGATTQQIYNGTALYLGNSVTVLARQALTIVGNTPDADFAFDSTLGGTIKYDFGDLPNSGGTNYNATLLSSTGAVHKITGLYLGAGVSDETDGKPSADAGVNPLISGDTNDDGVTLVSTSWVTGAAGASVNVTTSGAGWLAGWVDFNNDGDFDDAGELIVNKAVISGANPAIAFDIPGMSTSGLKTFFSRFRLYPAQPLFLSNKGMALDAAFQPAGGEVEDYLWDVNVTAAVISAFLAYNDHGQVSVAWETSSEIGTIGFYLRRWDLAAGRYVMVGDKLLPSLHQVPQGGVYRYVDEEAFPGATYDYELVEVEANGRQTTHGPFTGTIGEFVSDEADAMDSAAPSSRYEGWPHERPISRKAASGAKAADSRSTTTKATGKPGVAVESLKLGIEESGLYYLDPQSLADALGLTADRVRTLIRSKKLNLTNRGERVAFLPAEGQEGVFFYGENLDSLFARENVYWVENKSVKGLPMEERDETSRRAAGGDETFSRTVHEERDVYPGHTLFTDPESDYWLWDYFYGGWDAKAFPVRTDGIDPNSASVALTVRFTGGTNTEANPDHHAALKLNGTAIADFTWEGLEVYEQTYSLDPSLFVDGENTLEIAALNDTAAPYSLFYLDSFTVTYDSYYQAHDDALAFTAGGNARVRVGGFTDPDILVFDVTEPKRPIFIPTTTDSTGEGEYGVTLAPQSGTASYYALAAGKVRSVGWLRPDVPSSLRKSENRAAHLIVTTADLAGSARKLADYRSELGSMVVDIEDVYDEFNAGIPSPHALRDFLAYARSTWSKPPRYIVLAGDGTYDYKNNQGAGGNLLPPKMVSTPFGLFPSDNWFADVEGGRGAPEMAVGRLPAASAAELTQQIDKIIAREESSGADWVSRLTLLADNPDSGGDFPANSDAIAALAPAQYLVDQVHLGDYTLGAARTRLLQNIQDGTGLINFVGHAGFDTLASEGLLRNADLNGLLNDGKPTILVAQTCIAGYFALPGYPSIGELLVRKATGGAAAVWAPSGLSQDELAAIMARNFYAKYFSTGRGTIGDAILAATRAYEQTGNAPYMIDIHVLLGDPAMLLH